MKIIMDGEQLTRYVTYITELGVAIVDMDGVWKDVLAFGPAEDPSVWARWYHHQAHRHGWRAARYVVLVSACYSPIVVPSNGEGAHHA